MPVLNQVIYRLGTGLVLLQVICCRIVCGPFCTHRGGGLACDTLLSEEN